jgi:hypothetical protein
VGAAPQVVHAAGTLGRSKRAQPLVRFVVAPPGLVPRDFIAIVVDTIVVGMMWTPAKRNLFYISDAENK